MKSVQEVQKNIPIIVALIMFIIGAGCKLPNNEYDEGKASKVSELDVDSFSQKRAILAEWRGNARTEEYILMRARDEIDGVGAYEEIYRGQGVKYTDRDVQNDIRYVYRVDVAQKGKVHEGELTGIGVGNSAEVDLNEPNNKKEEATALSSFKRGTMYYFRFSDRRELADIDWYKVKVSGSGVAYLQIREDGVAGMTTLRMRFEGQEAFLAEHGKWYELKNEAKSERELYIEIRADEESYVETGLVGGTIRGYTIIRSDSMEDGGNDPGTLPGNNGNGTGGENTDPEGPVTPGEGIIEEKSELFEADGTGRLIFLLNEKRYQGRGYTFWKYLEKEWKTDEGMTMELAKESGNYLGGYGYFFAGGYVEGYGESMLVLLIQKDGNYTIGKAVAGMYEELVSWRNSVFLRKGYGVKNTAGVQWDNERKEYIVTMNGVEQARFVDTQEPVCTGVRTGIVAVVTGMEQFPQTPVKVGYR
jgi:hypothetical protein